MAAAPPSIIIDASSELEFMPPLDAVAREEWVVRRGDEAFIAPGMETFFAFVEENYTLYRTLSLRNWNVYIHN
jgi:hypothetical protein